MPAVPTMQHTLRRTHGFRLVQAKWTSLIENRRFQGRALRVGWRIRLSSEVVKPNKFWKTTLCREPISSRRPAVPTATPIYKVSILSRSLQGPAWEIRLYVHRPTRDWWQEASNWARARAPQGHQELAWALDMRRHRSWRTRARLRALVQLTQVRHSIVRGWRISHLPITLSGKAARTLNWIKN